MTNEGAGCDKTVIGGLVIDKLVDGSDGQLPVVCLRSITDSQITAIML
jgi:hypothetical protein